MKLEKNKRSLLHAFGLTQEFFFYLVSLILAGKPSSSADYADTPPNILWIVGENLNLDLGIYGARNVSTPHLDGWPGRGSATPMFSPPVRFVPRAVPPL
jgi:hypothetical protein